MRQIDVIVPLKGISTGKAKITTDASGFVGASCQEITKNLLQHIGGSQEEQLKDEYYAQEQGIERISDGST